MKLLLELIRLDAKSGVPLYLQVTNALIHHIRSGRLSTGLKLPGSRELAGVLKINRMTIVAAYDELQAQGWIDMQARKGTFVRNDLPELKPGKIGAESETSSLPAQPAFSYHASKVVAFPPSDFPDTSRLVINDGFPDSRLAPTELLFRTMRSQARLAGSRKYMMYGGATGTPLLRQILAGFLSETRGLPVSPDNLLVTRGAQMGIYLAASVLVSRGDHVVVGEPGYFGANLCFQQLGAQLTRVPVDAEGMDIAAVENACRSKKIRFVYVIPHHHHPTTVTLTPDRRVRLLELAARYKFAIIEDDYDYDFHYASKPMMPMASLDRHGSIIYVGTLTKTLAPAFRIGFVVAPARFIETIAHVRRSVDWQGDSLLENAIAELYKEGTIARHIKKSVKLYRERRDHFCELLQKEIGQHVSFKVPDGGMSVWTKFLSADLEKISANAGRKGLVLSNGSEYNTHTEKYNSARLGFASLNFEEQKRAVEILKHVLSQFSDT